MLINAHRGLGAGGVVLYIRYGHGWTGSIGHHCDAHDCEMAVRKLLQNVSTIWSFGYVQLYVYLLFIMLYSCSASMLCKSKLYEIYFYMMNKVNVLGLSKVI